MAMQRSTVEDSAASSGECHLVMQQQLMQIQSQMTAFMQAQSGSQTTGGPPGLEFSPEQTVKTPIINLDGAIAAAHKEHKRDALQPFGVARETKTTPGPYTPSPRRSETGSNGTGAKGGHPDKLGCFGSLRSNTLNGQLGQLALLVVLWGATYIYGYGLIMSPKWMRLPKRQWRAAT